MQVPRSDLQHLGDTQLLCVPFNAALQKENENVLVFL